MYGLRIIQQIKTPALVVFISAILIGCGGSDDNSKPLTYSGVTTAAAVTDANAETLALDTLFGSSGGTGIVLGAQTDDTPNASSANNIIVNSILDKVKNDITGGNEQSTVTGAVINGSCGGSVSDNTTATGTPDSYTFSGTQIFNNYCSGGLTISGTVTVSGSVDIIFYSGTSGNIVLTVTTSFTELVVRNNATGEIYLQANMTQTASIDIDFDIIGGTDVVFTAGTLTVSFSGVFYHPAEGYVGAETTIPFVFDIFSQYPTQGQLEVSELNASFVPTGVMARLTVINGGTQYTIERSINSGTDWTLIGTYTW